MKPVHQVFVSKCKGNAILSKLVCCFSIVWQFSRSKAGVYLRHWTLREILTCGAVLHKLVVCEPVVDFIGEFASHGLQVVLQDVGVDQGEGEQPRHTVHRVVVAPVVRHLIAD